MSIDRLSVHGEAMIIRLAVNDPEHEAWKKTVREVHDLGTPVLLRIIKQEFRERYELDFVSVSDGLVELYIAAYPRRRPTFVWSDTANRGENCELWVLRADRITEKIRRWLRTQLRRHDKKGQLFIRAEWFPGMGVDAAGGVREDSSDPGLRYRLDSLRRRQRFLRGRLLVATIVSTLALLITSGLAIAAVMRDDRVVWAYAGYIALIAVLWTSLSVRLVVAVREVRTEAQAVEETLDLNGLLDEDEKRAHKLFQINSAEVRRYYDQALRQRRYIFYLGVLCVLLGFGSVFIAFSLIGRNPESTLQEKVVIAVLGTVSGILANFVALIFLNMFSAIVKSMVSFHQRLVSTHHVVFSNVLVAKIEDKKLRDDTLAHVAIALSRVTIQEGDLDQVQREGEVKD